MMGTRQAHTAKNDRLDTRGEWFREWDAYAPYYNRIPGWYGVGMVLSALWLVVYLSIYPSVPLLTTHWQGLGVPGGCRPWTAICEMRVAQAELDAVRAPYLEKVRVTPLTAITADLALRDFVSSAGRVAYAEQCAGCHGGLGGAQVQRLAPSLSNLHGLEPSLILARIQDAERHPFGMPRRIDGLQAKILAVFVYQDLH